MGKRLQHISKLLSLVLRHQPENLGLTLNENGWANVNELIEKINTKGNNIDFAMLQIVVDTNDKKRFIFNEDKTMIRANQGHSIEVELDLKEVVPPDFLYHGTVLKFLEAIKKDGLKKMSRQHVHLSKEVQTATIVASRRGVPVILTVNAMVMHTEGFKFYLSENGVWLTDEVPSKYIELPAIK
jgi:putative RNA 2'-phosphotransferase